MTHHQKVKRLLAELSAKGVYRSTIAPPVFRQLWAFGIKIPPPLFIHFVPLMLFSGIYFGIFIGVVFWLTVCRNILLPSIGGTLFGFAVATFFRLRARTLKLPEWKDYPRRAGARTIRRSLSVGGRLC